MDTRLSQGAGAMGARLAGRLTAELILRSPQYMSAVKDYEIDLRGGCKPPTCCGTVASHLPCLVNSNSCKCFDIAPFSGNKITTIENLGATEVRRRPGSSSCLLDVRAITGALLTCRTNSIA